MSLRECRPTQKNRECELSEHIALWLIVLLAETQVKRGGPGTGKRNELPRTWQNIASQNRAFLLVHLTKADWG